MFEISIRQTSLARFIHSFADLSRDGKVTLSDLEQFCMEMPSKYENVMWCSGFKYGPAPHE